MCALFAISPSLGLFCRLMFDDYCSTPDLYVYILVCVYVCMYACMHLHLRYAREYVLYVDMHACMYVRVRSTCD